MSFSSVSTSESELSVSSDTSSTKVPMSALNTVSENGKNFFSNTDPFYLKTFVEGCLYIKIF